MGIDLWVPRAGTAPPPTLLAGAPSPGAVQDLPLPPPALAAAPNAPRIPVAPLPPARAQAPPPPPAPVWAQSVSRAPVVPPPTPRPVAPLTAPVTDAPRALLSESPPDLDPGWDTAWEPVGDPLWEPVGEPVWGAPPDAAPAAPAAVQTPAQPRIPRAAAPSAKAAAADPAPLLTDPAALDWDGLAAAVAGCRACALCETRTRTVFGVGDRQAHLLVIGEAPGADEDRAGEPFVGRAGQLLNQMLAAIGLERDQVYIANILKCRPPGNRNPHPGEVRQCQGYLARQVELIRPRVILSVGAVSAQHLLGTDTPVGHLRGRWFDYGPAAVPLRVTYHPAYLLRSPEQKGKAWEDLIAVARRLGSDA